MNWDRDSVRHMAMRLGLGFVMGWFGVQELRNPAEWSVFVPSFVANLSPVGLNDLILLHGFFLVLAACLVVVGLLYLPGTLLGMALMAEIVFGLWWDGGVSDLVIRDIGLFALAGALAIDPSRAWHFDNVVVARAGEAPRSARRRADRLGDAALTAWLSRALAVTALVGGVFVAGAVLYGTGTGASGPDNSALSLATAPPATAAAAGTTAPPATTAAAGTPAPSSTAAASSTQFAGWRYQQYAFQIYPGAPGSDAEKALAGFDLSVQDQGGSVLVNLKARQANYRDAQYAVPKGDTAYFIETTLRDDPNDQEENMGDDGVVVVNPDGYILRS